MRVRTGEAQRRSHGRAVPGAAGRFALLLGILALACWIVPLLRGRGHYKVIHLYLGSFAALAWLASLAVALAPARARRPLAVRLTAALGSLILALPLGDLAATLWSIRFEHFYYYSLVFPRSQNTPDPELIWKRKPSLTWHGRKTPDCDPVFYRTDEHGFRNPPGIRRADIIVVGDSVTEAGEVAEEATFVQKTGAALGLQVVNLGTSGYGPQQELVVLRRYGLAYQPRFAVWQVTEWNDVQDALMYLKRHELSERGLPPWKVLYARHSPAARLVAALAPGDRPNRVAFVRSDGQVEARTFWPYQPDGHERWPEGFAELKRSIAAAYELCRSRDIEFVVLYIPSHVRVLLPSLRFANEAERERFCPGGVADRAGDLAHAMAAFCHGLGCPMIDMSPRLRRRAAEDNRRIYVPNDPHLDIDGHDEVQRAIVQFVESRWEPSQQAAKGLFGVWSCGSSWGGSWRAGDDSSPLAQDTSPLTKNLTPTLSILLRSPNRVGWDGTRPAIPSGD
jgi:hypothetical protein